MLCRLCKASRESIQIHFKEDDFEQREMDDHDDSVEAAIRLRRNRVPETGVRQQCPLNSLQNFHCVTNYNLDVMHVELEGVYPYEVKLLLNHFIFTEQLITFAELNQRIRSFHSSFNDKKNKTSALASDRSLLQCMDIIHAPLVTSSQTVYLKH